ncbi:MAG: bifunctional diguanylate cyclase/phosphodiesterase [Kangiella sp.]|nr:MAG: bifunctional diguanylate cyclase/phosphodiesterase [Kangiella sp.]
MKISIKTIFTLSNYVSIVFALLFILGLLDLYNKTQEIRSIEHAHHLMLEKARELKQSSDELTRYARLYVISKETQYKDIYFNILSMRNGENENLKHYCPVYWELPESIRTQRHPLEKKSSLQDRMRKLPYLDSEFKNLNKSANNSNQLVNLEIKAFNALEGLFKDKYGKYTIERTPNQQLAIQLLSSAEYRLAKQSIMLPIDDFLHSLSDRTKLSVKNQKNKIDDAFVHLVIFLIMALSTRFYSLYITKKRVIAPINYLTKSIINNLPLNHELNKQVQNDDEIGFMIDSFFKMKKTIDDDLKRLEFALSAGRQGWFDFDLINNHIVVSAQYAQLIDLPAAQFIMPLEEWREGIHPEDRITVMTALNLSIDGRKKGDVEFRRVKDNGEIIWVYAIGEVVDWKDDGSPKRLIGMATDITESKRQQEALKTLAHYDTLTDLPNRNLFTDKFLQAVTHSHITKTQLAICYLDLDNFKPINDQFGHAVGDQLLVQVANTLKKNVNENDTVSRQGGDEFVLLLSDFKDFSECEKTLDKIHTALSKPFSINGRNHFISASSGVTVYPNDSADIDTLLRHADNAMYQAKIAGKNRYSLFNSEQDEKAIYKHGRLSEIEDALNKNQFQLYYQPKVNMRTGKVFGAEALIRWLHPKKGLVPPLEFLPIIEGTDLEIGIGNWVIEQAMIQLQDWNSQGVDIEISVNIASHHLQSSSFITSLELLLSNYPKIDPNKLQLEILESSALGDLKTISHVIDECRNRLNLNVALDDFGTGYSSLTHLRNLSANTVKIDQTFVRDVLEDPGDYAIIDGIVGLASAFDRLVIAEGVETIEQGLILLLMHCDNAQGYGIAKPMPANEFPEWLNQYQANNEWIEFAKTPRNRQERELEILKLTTDQWRKRFIDNLGLTDLTKIDWPIMDTERSSCGTWVRRAIQEQLFEEKWIRSIDKIHNNIHDVAKRLKMEFIENKGRVKKAHIDTLENTCKQLHDFIDQRVA